ncbi:MAG: hypothetical protein SVG88_03835 [Halobacteriales archaeon]|nr:hypothetical protein [Halobacteriales archaeon]
MVPASDSSSVPVYRNHHELLHIDRPDGQALLCRRCGKTAPTLDRFDAIMCEITDAPIQTP